MDRCRSVHRDSFFHTIPVLSAALQASDDAGLPAISVSPNQGKLLHMMARMIGATRILEVGTLGVTAPFGWRERLRKRKLTTLSLTKHAGSPERTSHAPLVGVVELRLGRRLRRCRSRKEKAGLSICVHRRDKQSNAGTSTGR